MSATGRGAVRHKDDFYETPTWLTRAVLPSLVTRLPSEPRVLEPAAGALAIVKEITAAWPKARVDCVDIRDPYCVDFLVLNPQPIYDLIITNPPYSLAMEFVQRAMLWRRSAHSLVAMLLRIPWLASQGRSDFLRANTPSILVSPKRPSFTADGKTDATDYAWFLWSNTPATVEILEVK